MFVSKLLNLKNKLFMDTLIFDKYLYDSLNIFESLSFLLIIKIFNIFGKKNLINLSQKYTILT